MAGALFAVAVLSRMMNTVSRFRGQLINGPTLPPVWWLTSLVPSAVVLILCGALAVSLLRGGLRFRRLAMILAVVGGVLYGCGMIVRAWGSAGRARPPTISGILEAILFAAAVLTLLGKNPGRTRFRVGCALGAAWVLNLVGLTAGLL